MTDLFADTLAYWPADMLLAIRPGVIIELPGVWATSPPTVLEVREVQPAMVAWPPSAWLHCVDELGRPVRVYVAVPTPNC